MAQVTQDFLLDVLIDLDVHALGQVIQLIHHVLEVGVDLGDILVLMGARVYQHGLALTGILEFDALGEELSLLLLEIDLEDVVVGFLAQGIAVH
ncbi:hypothetical protein D3C80_352730 [compost metagenome]